jgi:hypothetical protein
MTPGLEQFQDHHEKYSDLCALAMSGELTAGEGLDLKNHLKTCRECQQAYNEYLLLTKEGMPTLAACFSDPEELPEEEGAWDEAATRQKVHTRIAEAERQRPFDQPRHGLAHATSLYALLGRTAIRPLVWAAVAACLVAAISIGTYRYGYRKGNTAESGARQALASAAVSAQDLARKLASEKKTVDDLLRAQGEKLDQLQAESSRRQQEEEKLRSHVGALQARASDLAASKNTSDEQLRAVFAQRDALTKQLEEARRANQGVQAELSSLRTERDQAMLRLASLESLQSQVEELSATNRDQQRRLKEEEQFLSSDRDIRELMGARNLYIADVFDVDSSSRTRKPYGRVFYTKGKSLIFYAFDLDRRPAIKNASTFQAWGQRETPLGEQAQPVSLGILYVDNEANRRWALRCDDSKELAEIDAVFVTVEPRGGSEKPTGKPFLYALLRKEVNHP